MHDALVFAYDAQKIRRMIWLRKLNSKYPHSFLVI
jgi:hypothetical protein